MGRMDLNHKDPKYTKEILIILKSYQSWFRLLLCNGQAWRRRAAPRSVRGSGLATAGGAEGGQCAGQQHGQQANRQQPAGL